MGLAPSSDTPTRQEGADSEPSPATSPVMLRPLTIPDSGAAATADDEQWIL